MGANLDTGGPDRRAVDVDLNLVPFIDVLSCLTAFLMMAAVWVRVAQIDVAPEGKDRDRMVLDDNEPAPLSVLVTRERIYVGAARPSGDGSVDVIARDDGRPPAQVWDQLQQALARRKAAWYADRTDIELAAASSAAHAVPYQDLVSAMDRAIRAGFPDVRLSDPAGLSWRPTR